MAELKVYYKTTCPYCIKLMNILDQRGVEYEKIDFILHPEVAKILITRDGNTPAPQVEYKGTIIFDYTTEEALADRIQEMLKN